MVSTEADTSTLAAALQKAVFSREGARLSAAECSALLAAVCTPAPSTSTAACAVKALRAKAAEVEKDHAVAVELGQSGVRMAVQAIVRGVADGKQVAEERQQKLRVAADGAAALADMVAAAGANKLAALRERGDRALLACIEQHAELVLGGGESSVAGALAAELSLQACRALGNLCYGWDVDAIKDSIGTRGAALVVRAMQARLGAPPPAAAARSPAPASLYRWEAHALRNLAVRSPHMQAAIGEAGGVAALAGGLRAYAAAPRAQEAGCKALAFVLAGSAVNCAAAVAEGALEMGAAVLRAHAADAGAAEAALTLLCLAVAAAGEAGEEAAVAVAGVEEGGGGAGAGGGEAVAVAVRVARCGAHIAALEAVRTLLSARPGAHAGDAPPRAEAAEAEAEEPGKPTSWGALVRSALWLLATLAGAVVEAVPSAAHELEARGLRELFGSEAGVKAQGRSKVRAEVQRCLARLGAAREEAAEVEAEVEAEVQAAREATELARGEGASAAPRPAAGTASSAVATPPARDGAGQPPHSGVALVLGGEEALSAGGESTAAQGSGEALSSEDLATCVGVLERLAKEPALLQAPSCRALRKAFAPIHKAMSVREAGTLEYARQRQLKKEQQARQISRCWVQCTVQCMVRCTVQCMV